MRPDTLSGEQLRQAAALADGAVDVGSFDPWALFLRVASVFPECQMAHVSHAYHRPSWLCAMRHHEYHHLSGQGLIPAIGPVGPSSAPLVCWPDAAKG